MVLRMPMLSPSMTSASVVGWHVAPGQELSEYDLAVTLSVESLTKEAAEDNSMAADATLMDIEVIENAYLCKILAPVGVVLPVGTPLAILSDDKGELEENGDGRTDDEVCAQSPDALWQAYVQERAPSCG
jgi:pyruvate/2-oxoglutarate dehydrogenase complex dihydrolipoamide acyltransferase (E2) component